MIERMLAIVGLILLSPLLILIGVMIKITSRGPILFKQERVGLDKQLFTIYKFRTMCNKSPNDERIIFIGYFLRRTHLDELPQLLNILKGEMRFVGPRPCMSYEEALYPEWSNERFSVKPGLTGLWQISGNNIRNITEKLLLDIHYVRSRTIKKDISIVLQTIPIICWGKEKNKQFDYTLSRTISSLNTKELQKELQHESVT